MKHSIISNYIHRRVFGLFVLTIAILAIAAPSIQGQWRIVAPSLTRIGKYGGAMCFQDGTVWIANDAQLFMSKDSGMIWTTKLLPSTSGVAWDIQFYDLANGVVSSVNGAWVTSDTGNSWQEIWGNITTSACFLNSVSSIGISPGFPNVQAAAVTVDKGSNWRNMPGAQSDWVFCVRYKNGTIYELGGDKAGGDYFYTSSDLGLTWQQSKSSVDYDTFSFAIDSCDANRIYVSHEDYLIPTDNFSKIYLSKDRGDTWQTVASKPEPFFNGSIAEGLVAVYCQTIFNGVFRSTDEGITWSSIGGPSIGYDTRLISALTDNILLAVDGDGNLWRTDNSGGDSIPVEQLLPPSNSIFVISPQSNFTAQSGCNNQVDSSIPLAIAGCGILSGHVDSLWLTGSTAFQISDTRSVPRSLASSDSILVQYTQAKGVDTAELHIRYDVGSGAHDTTVQLIGKPGTALSAQPVKLHREVASSYFGSLDSLPLGVDMSSSINIDSLWPFLHDISGTYSFDSSIVEFAGYLSPSGWTATSMLDRGDTIDFSIHNLSSTTPSQPVNLGTAVFLPASSLLATSDVNLSNLLMNIGNQSIAPCVTSDEDQHWSVKVLSSDAVEQSPSALPYVISVYPNPAGDELFVQNQNDILISVTMFDVIGRKVASANILSNSTSMIDIEVLPHGSYVLVCGIGSHIITRRVDKVQ